LLVLNVVGNSPHTLGLPLKMYLPLCEEVKVKPRYGHTEVIGLPSELW
jgi:hypothetical protein